MSFMPQMLLFWVYLMFVVGMEDSERPGQMVLVPIAREILIIDMVYVQRGLLSDQSDVPVYRAVRTLSSGFVVFRCVRSSSQLEGQHQHYREAQNSFARHAGPLSTSAWGLLFDFSWKVRALVRAGGAADLGNCWLWLADATLQCLRDCQETWVPELYGQHAAIDTVPEPIITWGVQWSALGIDTARAIPSTLRTVEEIDFALANRQIAIMIVQKDANGIERSTELRTTAADCTELIQRVRECARAETTLKSHGSLELYSQLRRTLAAPAQSSMALLRLPLTTIGEPCPLPHSAVAGRQATYSTIALDFDDAVAENDEIIFAPAGDEEDHQAQLTPVLRTSSAVPPAAISVQTNAQNTVASGAQRHGVGTDRPTPAPASGQKRSYGGTETEREARRQARLKRQRAAQKEKRDAAKQAQFTNSESI